MSTRTVPLIASVLLMPIAGCAAAPVAPLAQQPPDDRPALFAPGIVSTANSIELNGVLAPDGREFLFTRIVDGEYLMHCSRFVDSHWTAPEPLRPFGGGQRALAVDMSYSADGRRPY